MSPSLTTLFKLANILLSAFLAPPYPAFFFFFFFKLPHWVFVVAHGLLTRCEGFSCCEAPAPLALGSVVAAPGLCCPTACETLVPQPGRD